MGKPNLQSHTMGNMPTDRSPLGFADEDFVVENYENANFCDLQNENLFPIQKFPMFCESSSPSESARNSYALIQPALLLLSRIIIQRWDSFNIFVQRQRPGAPEEWLDADVGLELSQEETV